MCRGLREAVGHESGGLGRVGAVRSFDKVRGCAVRPRGQPMVTLLPAFIMTIIM